MAAEDFFSRWARKNQEARHPSDPSQTEDALKQADGTDAPVDTPKPAAFADTPPTLDDVEQLPIDGDFSPFVKKGVDESVKRSALKKLFTDPHFNIMDGLDIYIDDYSLSDPIPPEMLAMLEHAKSTLNPPGLTGQRVMEMLSDTPPPAAPETEAVGTDADAEADAESALEEGAESEAGTASETAPDPEAGTEDTTASTTEPAAGEIAQSDVANATGPRLEHARSNVLLPDIASINGSAPASVLTSVQSDPHNPHNPHNPQQAAATSAGTIAAPNSTGPKEDPSK